MIRRKKTYTIGLLYHYIPKENADEYYSSEHALTDSQTDDAVKLIYAALLKSKIKVKVKIVRIQPDDVSALKTDKCDLLFNLVDSKAMEMYVSKVLSRIETPYTGATIEGIRLSNNKIKSKHIFLSQAIPTPQFTVIGMKERITRSMVPSKYPVIIKPAFEHCSISMTQKSVAWNFSQFRSIVLRLRKSMKQLLLAEEFIAGEEVHITVLEKGETTVTLPIAQMQTKKKALNRLNIYGFTEKFVKGSTAFESTFFIAPPKKIPELIQKQMQRDAIRAFYALRFKDYARFDLRYVPETKSWYFLEGNANPGICADVQDAMNTSLSSAKMSLEQFVLQIVKNTLPI